MTLDPIRTRWELETRIDHAIGPDPTPTPTTNGHTLMTFSAQTLRGIPAIGRGVQGCIPGTEPGSNLDDWPIPSSEEAA